MSEPVRQPFHPIVWTILYFPFGALGGFVSFPLTFLATQHGMSISEGAWLNGANMLSQWWKWTWAPAVDVTLSPKLWYLFSIVTSAVGILAMSAIPLSSENLPILLPIIAIASLVNTVVGMSLEAIIAATTPREDISRNSAWFQAGNLGGAGLAGGGGLYLLKALPAPWMTGAVFAVSFLACGLLLLAVPNVKRHGHELGPVVAIQGVFHDVLALAKTKGGLLAAVLCFLPIGTGAGQGVLMQSAVAAHWGAGEADVEWFGLISAAVNAAGCFMGGALCTRLGPQRAYTTIGAGLALVATLMALTPATPFAYMAWNIVYALGVGLAYAAFTAVVLDVMGKGSGASKYTIYASLSNFPIWWLGLLLGSVADTSGPEAMLLTEAALAVLGVGVFALSGKMIARTKLADTLVEDV